MSNFTRRRTTLLLQLLGDLGSVLALVESCLELQLRWLTSTIACESSRSVRRPTSRLIHGKHTSSTSVSDGDEDHAVMRQLGDGRQCSGFLATALASGTDEEPRGLSSERLRPPQPTGGVQKRLELSSHHPVSGGEPEQKPVGFGQILRLDERHIGLRRRVHLRQNLLWQGLGDLVQNRLHALHRVGTLLDFSGELLHVPVHGVVPADTATTSANFTKPICTDGQHAPPMLPTESKHLHNVELDGHGDGLRLTGGGRLKARRRRDGGTNNSANQSTT
ncbi:hypothetical protein KC19_1G324400 [Ceratodon purpureus]|uniref:Secreted protein n=1 Tax=Ceratodon purpureus TaxID=3225 RepID=A0A8T0JFC6_CERPU|nr:hypothetical protein KC19_1G324400 [Ceratodon purpureus]